MNTVTEPEHPGKVVFVDGSTQEIAAEVDASSVPLPLRFVEIEDVFYPVVKIVVFTTEAGRTIRQYGPGDELLKSTVQARSEG
jgi:hypothetical protein